ncbi:hypothetical protein CROQUDRAFT_660273, partial [Cronartium quercuum f. sp. fusiforme G11]
LHSSVRAEFSRWVGYVERLKVYYRDEVRMRRDVMMVLTRRRRDVIIRLGTGTSSLKSANGTVLSGKYT